MITNTHNAISKILGQLKKQLQGEKIWDIPKNIEAGEKWVQKKEELVKETNENKNLGGEDQSN